MMCIPVWVFQVITVFLYLYFRIVALFFPQNHKAVLHSAEFKGRRFFFLNVLLDLDLSQQVFRLHDSMFVDKHTTEQPFIFQIHHRADHRPTANEP